MNYDARIETLNHEHNQIMASISQQLARMNFLQGQITVLLQLKAEDEQAKKAAAEKPAESQKEIPF